MKLIRLNIFILFFVLVSQNNIAQQFNDDAKLWLYIKMDKDVSAKLNVQLALQNRIENNMSEIGQINSKLEFTYKINKHFRAVAAYGFGENRSINGSYGIRHQAYVGFIIRKKVKSFLFSYRNIVQAQVKNVYSSESGAVPLLFDRNKINIRYELNKRFDIYVEQEINLSYNQFEYDNVSRSRTSAGVIYNISKKINIEGYFMFQKHFRYTNQPRRDFIYGLTYSHSF